MSAPEQPPAPRAAFAVVGHEALFEASAEPAACDVCGADVGEDSGEGPAVPGLGMYLWARGEETRREEVPLCDACAAALGVAALARWEIEEEEG
ncbi:MAG TPA: hypothetical protein VGI39_14470 [Polyangiaceae bacterium]